MIKAKKHKSLNMSYSKKRIMPKKEGDTKDISNFAKISQQYMTLVENANKNNEDFFIDNSTFEHAKFLTYTLISRAKKTIKIFTGDLSEIYYNNSVIVSLIEDKLKKGVQIDIAIENKTKTNKILSLKKKYSKLINIYPAKKNTSTNHFLLVDENSFRIEFPHDKKDTTLDNFNVHAKANFYNRAIGRHIEKVFGDLIKPAPQ